MIQGEKTKTYNISADLVPVDIEVIKAYMLGARRAFFRAYFVWWQ